MLAEFERLTVFGLLATEWLAKDFFKRGRAPGFKVFQSFADALNFFLACDDIECLKPAFKLFMANDDRIWLAIAGNNESCPQSSSFLY
ncbi:MAG: hypothetical protein AUH95_02170 [Nitrospirae bacterium 13_2_20CM_2_63_8]|nr:MAG: hypothetical protein AUH95_02170 [Nitrospirae bacterium 13_2_20CM_2_63_8]